MRTTKIGITAVEKRYPRPKGWRVNVPANESDICIHADTWVCRECQTRYADRLIDVFGAFYWMETDSEKAEWLASLDED